MRSFYTIYFYNYLLLASVSIAAFKLDITVESYYHEYFDFFFVADFALILILSFAAFFMFRNHPNPKTLMIVPLFTVMFFLSIIGYFFLTSSLGVNDILETASAESLDTFTFVTNWTMFGASLYFIKSKSKFFTNSGAEVRE